MESRGFFVSADFYIGRANKWNSASYHLNIAAPQNLAEEVIAEVKAGVDKK